MMDDDFTPGERVQIRADKLLSFSGYNGVVTVVEPPLIYVRLDGEPHDRPYLVDEIARDAGKAVRG